MALRVGIISANWGTFAHLPAWRAVPGVEVTAVCTSRRETAEAAAKQHGIPRAFWDAGAMCADPDIDIVDCGTRPSIRQDHVLAALRHRKHVYNGIPFARDFAGARAIHAAWRAAGTVAVTDAFSEWVPALRLAGEMVADGYLGRPFGGTCWFTMALFNPLRPGFPYNWFAEEGMGVSAVRNLGSQALNLLLPLFGPVAELVAVDERKLDRWTSADGAEAIDARTNDFAGALLRFESGLLLQMQIGWNVTAGPGWYLDAHGSEGRIVTAAPSFPTSRDTTIAAGRRGDAAVRPLAIPARLTHGAEVAIDADAAVQPAHPMALSMDAMVRAIAGEGTAHPDFEQAWQVERVQEAIRRSSAEHRWVRLDEVV